MELKEKSLLDKFNEIIEYNLNEGRQTWQVELAMECGYVDLDPDPNSPRIPEKVLDKFESDLTIALANESIRRNDRADNRSILKRLTERELLWILKFNLYSLKRYSNTKRIRDKMIKEGKRSNDNEYAIRYLASKSGFILDRKNGLKNIDLFINKLQEISNIKIEEELYERIKSIHGIDDEEINENIGEYDERNNILREKA